MSKRFISELSRREFLKKLGCLSLMLATTIGCDPRGPEPSPSAQGEALHEAMFYAKLSRRNVQCQICFRRCIIPPGTRGFCRNRENHGGKLYTLVYGKPCSLQIDPIEKEPAFHMLPRGKIFCTATVSCNNRCLFCQNWQISQRSVEEVQSYQASPEEVVAMAEEKGCEALSFTYSEPTAFYEYMFDIAKLGKERGLKTLYHTNGLINAEPLLALLKYMDAVTVDLKAFTSQFYQEICSSELEPVLATLKNMRKTDVHLEVVNLVIPGLNDDMGDIENMCLWIKDNLGEETPFHLNRFFPAYKMERLLPTPVETLERAKMVADEVGLHYVYVGNVPGHTYNSTFCPRCSKALITRLHFQVFGNDIVDGRCKFCGHPIPGIWI